MARLLVTVDESWYDELALIASYTESEYERKIRQHISTVFPDYITCSYKLSVETESREPRKPDLVMIRNDYSDWWIVEIELQGHSFDHVMEQIIVFSEGIYNSYKVSDYIYNKCYEELQMELNKDDLQDLVKDKQPNVLVIVDEPKPDWERKLDRYNAKLCVFQVFKNTRNMESFRLDGDYPIVAVEESHCKYDTKIPNLIEVLTPNIIEEKEHEDIAIVYNDKTSLWRVIKLEGRCYLRSLGKINFVPTANNYVLFKDTFNRYNLKLN